MKLFEKFPIAFLLILFGFTFTHSVNAGRTKLKLTDTEYLDSPCLSVLAFHNSYPVGKQGGIEIIQHDRRIATNGNVHVSLVTKSSSNEDNIVTEPIPEITNPERVLDRQNDIIKIPFEDEEHKLQYQLSIKPLEDNNFSINLSFNESIDLSVLDEAYFEIELYPEYYKGKSYISDKNSGVFPFILTSSPPNLKDKADETPLAIGKQLVIAQESPEYKIIFESGNKPIELIDKRDTQAREWFAIRVQADLTKKDKAIELVIKPNCVENWQREPVIAYSQVGYHPQQAKKAIIELDQRFDQLEKARLIKLQDSGQEKVILDKQPEKWGNYYRYTYGIFDFSNVTDDGVYMIEYHGQRTGPFKINRNVYKQGVWQPSLVTFLPVQMCHMRVKDRNRLWHGLCHMDDGLQAPAPLEFYDGYDQGEETETKYEPNTTIPGMNQGGWHDAGDDDVNTGSSGRTTYHLALTYDEFQPEVDQTTIDFANNNVIIHQPDGIPDMLQQIEHGVDFLLAQYRASDHSFVGMISKDWETYLQEGQWGHMTDNFFYNPNMPEDSVCGKYSGKFDDRYIFTNKDSRREYEVITFLAASSRVLQEQAPEKARECRSVAEKIWQYEENHEPVFYPSVGTARDLLEQRTNAAVELYLLTEDQKYLDEIVDSKNKVIDKIDKTGWTISRVIDDISDSGFKRAFEKSLKKYQKDLNNKLESNPFGVFQDAHVWGMGWDILWNMYTYYYLVEQYPEIFDPQPLESAVNYVLGAHASSNISFVSGVGSHEPIPAFGMNRSDYSYTPGGLFSGINQIRPDFPELKSDHPYLWQQSEYIVFGATPFIFAVNAVDHLYNQ